MVGNDEGLAGSCAGIGDKFGGEGGGSRRCGAPPGGMIVVFSVGVESDSSTAAGADSGAGAVDGGTRGAGVGCAAMGGTTAGAMTDGGLYDRTRKGGAGRSVDGGGTGARSGGIDEDTSES